LELEQQGFAVRLAQHERHPSFSVSPYYSQARAGDREQNYGIGLSLPLPLSSANRAGSDAAVARQRQAEVALLLAQRELERAVITTAQAFAAKVAEAQRWAPESVEKFREAAALADRHYRLGAVPVGTYVELQTSYLDAVEALLDTRTEALEAGLTLQQLTGLELNRIGILP
jgi:cobalt-zinc-cadmium efflux system outer membrane protein